MSVVGKEGSEGVGIRTWAGGSEVVGVDAGAERVVVAWERLGLCCRWGKVGNCDGERGV